MMAHLYNPHSRASIFELMQIKHRTNDRNIGENFSTYETIFSRAGFDFGENWFVIEKLASQLPNNNLNINGGGRNEQKRPLLNFRSSESELKSVRFNPHQKFITMSLFGFKRDRKVKHKNHSDTIKRVPLQGDIIHHWLCIDILVCCSPTD